MILNTKQINTAFIGDRLVDTARALGIYPSLMATSITPMIEAGFPFTRQIECTACVMHKEQSKFVYVAKKMEIKQIVLEQSPDTDLDPSLIAQDFIRQGFGVEIVDFTRGTPHGIMSTARVLKLEKRGEKIVTLYEKNLQQAQDELPRDIQKKVLVLLGMTNREQEQSFLLVEENGLFEQEIFKPTGCKNVGKFIENSGAASDDNHVRVIKCIDGIMQACPDLIVLTCDPGPGLAAIRQYVNNHPADAAKIPALANHDIVSLPHCCCGTPMLHPHVLKSWGQALNALVKK